MAYSKNFFSLQLKFVKKVSKLTGNKFEDLIIDYSSFYKTFRISGWKFDQQNPEWQQYLKAIKDRDPVETTYQYYLSRIKMDKQKKRPGGNFGCFSYEFEQENSTILIHFANKDDPRPGALSRDKFSVRMAELKMVFAEIKAKYSQAKCVKGFSWLYNIDAYKRLFPPAYIANQTIVKNWFRSGALWGQFLDSYGEVKTGLSAKFMRNLNRQKDLSDLWMCFPLPVVEVNGKPEDFYSFYGL